MNRAVRSLWVLPVAVCFAVACGCSESPSVEPAATAPEPADVAPEPPLPPPPAPDLSGLVVDEPAKETPSEEVSDPEEPEREQSDPPPDGPLTAEQARSAIEELGGRVVLDESGGVVKVFLNRTRIDDKQIRAVEFLPNIEILNLTGTQITDDGLDHVHALKKLRHLYPAKTRVTDAGLEDLQEVLPDCKVYR